MEEFLREKSLDPLVQRLREDGFPDGIETEEYLENLDQEDRRPIFRAYEAIEAHQEHLDDEVQELADAQKQEQRFAAARAAIEEAILVGHLEMQSVQDWAVAYGALPDPDHDLKYYRGFQGFYNCWDCDRAIQQKTRYLTVRDGLFPNSGSGEVRQVPAIWCPGCEDEPPDRGIIREQFNPF